MAEKKTRYVDNGWPTSDPDDHAVSELAADRTGALSPFGDITFPLPASDLLPSQLRARSVVHVRYTQVGDPEGGARLFRRLRRAAPVVLDCAGTH